jgi:predicted kinase
MELRADLVEVEHHLDAKIAGVKADVARLEERIERRTAESDARIQVVRSDLIKWVLGTGVAAIFTVIGAAWTIIRYLPPHP